MIGKRNLESKREKIYNDPSLPTIVGKWRNVCTDMSCTPGLTASILLESGAKPIVASACT